jgi:hypothetical protein
MQVKILPPSSGSSKKGGQSGGEGGSRNGNNRNQNRRRGMSFKDLTEAYNNPKEMLKRDLGVIEVSIEEHFTTMFQHYRDWRNRVKDAKEPKYIYNMLMDFAFASALPKLVKQHKELIEENGEEFSEVLARGVAELSKPFGKGLSHHREAIAIYTNLYEDLNEERIRRIRDLNVPGVEWEQALRLALFSHGAPKYTVWAAAGVLYREVKTHNYDKVLKLLKRMYSKKELPTVGLYLLLDKRNQVPSWIDKELYSLLTNIALDEIEALSKDEVKDILQKYCSARRREESDKVIERRIRFSSISKDDYPKITKMCKKLAKKNGALYATYLDQLRVSDKKKPVSNKR